MMKIKWWGHSCFSIEINGIKILTDPYDDSLPYKKFDDYPDYVTVSHGHFDHNAVERVNGDFKVVDSEKGLKNDDLNIEALKSYHDSSKGKNRGENLIYLMEIGDYRICHLGDLGHLLAEKTINKIKNVDLLLIPVGGNYTIDAETAYKLTKKIEPKLIIPMHFKTDILDFPITGVEKFTDKFDEEEVNYVNESEINLGETENKQVIVLNYS
ncbi:MULTISPECIES: MBL fold metallo-hydrolase [Halanaerobium]|nr:MULTISPECIES: MBL fold metallo-hydrolase [Halanaerobium]